MSYRVQMSGDMSFSLSLPAERIRCGPAAADERPVCSMPYPASQPDLAPGASVTLHVSANWGGTKLRGEQSPSWVRRPTLEQIASISSRIQAMDNWPVEEPARLLLEGNLFIRNRLYARAIDCYRQALDALDFSEVRVALADTYLVVGLINRAGQAYQDVLKTNLRSEVRASATMGLGRVELARRRFGPAGKHFEEARNLYRDLNLAEDAARASEELKEANAEFP